MTSDLRRNPAFFLSKKSQASSTLSRATCTSLRASELSSSEGGSVMRVNARERDEEGSEIHRAAAVDVRLGVDVAEDVVVDVLHLELGARGEELGILDRAVLVRVDALEHHADVLERPEHRGEFHREGLQGLNGVDAGVSVAVLAELAREGQVEGAGGLRPRTRRHAGAHGPSECGG